MVATADAIADMLTEDGLVLRHRTDGVPTDGLHGGEGTFVRRIFWLVEALARRGETGRATALFERALGLCNDVGLLSEEYDTTQRRMLGNFPQAFSKRWPRHVTISSSRACSRLTWRPSGARGMDPCRRGRAGHRLPLS